MIDKENVFQRKVDLLTYISMRRYDIELLLDFAMGYKSLPNQNFRLIPYQRNDLRLISTIREIHKQIREMQKELALLDRLYKKFKENK